MTLCRTRGLLLAATFLLHGAIATAQSLPQGASGIASRYSGDNGIASDPAVIFADDFESYTGTSGLTGSGKWNNYYQSNQVSIATGSPGGTVYSGTKSLQLNLPQSNSELSNAVIKLLSVGQDVLHVRVYTKFEAGFNGTTEGHNGIRIQGGKYPGAGTRANGTNFFIFMLENSVYYGEPYPGYLNLYTYHPEMRDNYGDHFYPTGKIIPYDSTPHNFGSTFVARPNWTPQTDRWYSYELMVKLNTPGQRDGRATVWIDGVVVADFPNLRMRDTTALKIDHIELELHGKNNPDRADKKWYDNVVIATSYIGPVGGSPVAGSLPAPTNLRVQ